MDMEFIYRTAFSIGVSITGDIIVELLKKILFNKRKVFSKDDIADLLNKILSKIDDIDKNNKKQLAEILTRLDAICEVVENIKRENNIDIVVVANKDDDYMVKIPELPQQETLLLLEQKEFVLIKENPPHIEKMNVRYNFDFDFKKCDNCPLFTSELHKIKHEEMVTKIKIEREERDANSLKKCKYIPMLISDLLIAHLNYDEKDSKLCVFKGVHSGDNYLEKAIIPALALRDTHYYIVNESATIIEEIRVSDNLVDDKFLKIVSKHDGYLIVYGAILFTFENGYIKY